MRPDVIPQLADAERGARARSTCRREVSVSVLIPNERGLDRALALRERHRGERPAFDEVNVFLSASETAQPQERQPLDRGVAERASSACSRARARRGCAARA